MGALRFAVEAEPTWFPHSNRAVGMWRIGYTDDGEVRSIYAESPEDLANAGRGNLAPPLTVYVWPDDDQWTDEDFTRLTAAILAHGPFFLCDVEYSRDVRRRQQGRLPWLARQAREAQDPAMRARYEESLREERETPRWFKPRPAFRTSRDLVASLPHVRR